MSDDPSAVLAAIKAELYEARGVDLVDFNTITLLADALQAVLDVGREPSLDSFAEGYNAALGTIRRTISIALAKGETS